MNVVVYYKDRECTEPIEELKLDDHYIEDIYGGVLENTIEVGTEVTKTVYIKNNEDDMILIRGISSESPFVSAVVANARIGSGEVSELFITFKPTLEELRRLREIENVSDRNAEKKRLLSTAVELVVARIFML